MSLASELEKLQRQRHEEIRTLHQTYLRTKRTVIRTASPARIVRRHMGVSLGLAAAVGLLLAPRPSPSTAPAVPSKPPTPGKAKGGLASHLGWLKNLVGKVSPQVASYMPETPDDPKTSHEHEEEAAPMVPPPSTPPRGSILRRIISTAAKEAAALALSKVDFHKLMADMMQKVAPPPRTHEEDPSDSEPSVSVADVGTVKPHDYENFQ